MAFGHCEFEACISDTFEDFFDVDAQVICVVGCDANIIDVLRTLVSFYRGVEVLTREAGKADKERLRPGANLRYAKVLLAKLKANICMDW